MIVLQYVILCGNFMMEVFVGEKHYDTETLLFGHGDRLQSLPFHGQQGKQ